MSEEIIEPDAVEVEEALEVIEETPEVAVVIPEPEPEPMPEPEPAVEVEKPQPMPKEQPNPVIVVSGDATDKVYLAKCVYKNKFERKSLTVHHLQRRLVDLGFVDAGADADGYYGDLTKISVSKFQESKGLPVTGLMDVDTFVNIFNGDPNVDPVF